MSRRGRPKHIYEVSYHEIPGSEPVPHAPTPWSPELSVHAHGDVEWAAKAMCISTSYLRLLLSARRGEDITSIIVFKGCRMQARLRRLA